MRIPKRILYAAPLCALVLAAATANSHNAGALDSVYQGFLNPPDDARIMMRWWWFGPAVEKHELERELRVMKAAGIGGVEIQPVYPLELDDPQTGFHNTPYLSDEFLANVRFAALTAKSLGMRVDITLGSGWPYGGPHTPVTEAAGRLRIAQAAITDNERSVPIPATENGEKLLAAFMVRGTGVQFAPEDVTQISKFVNGRALLPEMSNGPHTVLFFIGSRTGQQVKRAAIGAEGFVLDHYDRAAIEHHLQSVADRLMEAFGSNPPHAVFSDSLEVFGSDWTGNFLDEFRKRRGYDLTPYLPALLGDMGPKTPAIRHDWAKTLTELADANYLMPLRNWAHAHQTLFRSQTYGEPPVEMSANNLVDLPEGEHGPEWRSFSDARWASSACHLYGRPITSAETWTWLHAPSFRATPLDMKAEADLHFIQGINQLVGHGWPYSPPSAPEPGWRFYASGAFNDHNPWFQVMPDLAKYLQRMSYLMRQGGPANDVALYLPTDDAWARFNGNVLDIHGGYREGAVALDQNIDELLGRSLIPQILNAGYNFDFIDDEAMAKAGVAHRILIIPGVERMPLLTLRRIEDFVSKGGFAIIMRRLPSLATGLQDEDDAPRVQALAQEILSKYPGNARLVNDEQMIGTTLKQMLTPDFAVQSGNSAIGFVHRNLVMSESMGSITKTQRFWDVYFVVNTANQAIDTEASIRISGVAGEWWNPFTGEATPIRGTGDRDCTELRLRLAPYESRVLVFASGQLQAPEAESAVSGSDIDISADWKVTFDGLQRTDDMPQLKSWTENPETQYYSGQASYEKSFDVPGPFLKAGKQIDIDLGQGQPVMPIPMPYGMRAWLESPVRESALVYVNGQLAGSVWHPPYAIPITKCLHAGRNQVRIVVGNLAINEIAGKALPDYRLLMERYGDRFQPQGFADLDALPSGMLGPVHILGH